LAWQRGRRNRSVMPWQVFTLMTLARVRTFSINREAEVLKVLHFCLKSRSAILIRRIVVSRSPSIRPLCVTEQLAGRHRRLQVCRCRRIAVKIFRVAFVI
jgi:hypothetical protein